MFNGIVETVGIVLDLFEKEDCIYLCISKHPAFNDLKIGDSIAVNGICLTITDISHDNFKVTVVPETIRKTNLKTLVIGSPVNLERSLKVTDRIHGHYLQGHVDAVSQIIEMIDEGKDARLVKISVPDHLRKYIIKKGYIALDGMSITVIDAKDDWISITLIPHTINSTIAKAYQVGSLINTEVDIFGKYIEKIFGEIKHASTS
jgi:riboflavin synthase